MRSEKSTSTADQIRSELEEEVSAYIYIVAVKQEFGLQEVQG